MYKRKYQCHMAACDAHTTNSNTYLLTAQKKPPKNNSHTKEPAVWEMEVYEKRSQENGPEAEKINTERATGLGRTPKEEKSGIKLKGLRFQTGGRHQKSSASIRGLQKEQCTSVQ